ncbi:MAG TPA: hypothetical protein VE093_03730 [Polyangiaceae bacterium]|nr:hypothetical protein [Polyangiaceae bacterium]
MNQSSFAWSLIGFVAAVGIASCAQGTSIEDEEYYNGEEDSGDDEDSSGAGPSSSSSVSSGTGTGTGGAGGAGGTGSGASSSSSSGAGSSSSSSGGGPVCSDGTCAPGETCMSCPKDCGPCVVCGDGKCDASETCTTCAGDCGPCPLCGDGKCNASETCMTCAGDCGPCPGGNCAHDICMEGAPLNPNCDPCVTVVCAFDPFCCDTAWDILCVEAAVNFCGAMCP